MSWRKVAMVAARDFQEDVQTKGFWIGIFVLPGILVLSLVLPIWLRGMREARPFAVVDRSGWLVAAVEARALRDDLVQVLTSTTARLRADTLEARVDPVLKRALATVSDVRAALPNESGIPEAAQQQIVVLALAAAVAGVESAERVGIETVVSSRPELGQAFRERTAELREWWAGLEANEARRFGERVSRGRYVLRAASPADAGEVLNRRVAAGNLFAYFVIPEDPLAGDAAARYVSRNVTDESLRDWFTRVAGEEIRDRRLAARGIEPEVSRWVQQRLPVVLTKLDERGRETEVDEEDFLREIAPAAFTYILWMAVFAISQGLLLSTIEEKSSRVMEVLLSSVSPRQLMAGKILGAMSTGLTTVAAWTVLAFVIVFFLPGVLDRSLGLGPVDIDLASILADPRYLLSFVVYFLLAHLLFATLLVGIGSLCNTVQESQSLMAPVTALMVVPLLGMLSLMDDPNSTVARVMSYIPPFTPFAMMGRAAVPPTMIEYVATTLLLLLTIVAVFLATVRVFSVGILMTGKPPRWREIVRWIREPQQPRKSVAD